ncbi:MAG: hypothetical protein QOI64_1758 [Solirubrobacteraceae bacterium]|nr:hypothetical protein [Solirubrobacteraceae bacterium]
MRRLLLVTAVLAMVAAGIAGASVVSPGGSAPPLPRTPDAAVAVPGPTGDTVPDPRGGPPWAVRINTGASGSRCVTVGRTDGRAFGPVDATGRILDTGLSASGSCAGADREPLQVALARYGDTAGTGPRTVLFGVADASVVRVEVAEPEGVGPVSVDRVGAFVVVSERLAPDAAWQVIATLSDGTQRIYPL